MTNDRKERLEQVLKQAESLSEPTHREITKAMILKEHGFTTEAVVRLGRALEAALYHCARSIGLSLRNVTIPDLDKVSDGILEANRLIVRQKRDTDVEKLADNAKLLAKAIAVLSRKEELRPGRETDELRRTSQLLVEIINDNGLSDAQKKALGLQRGALEVAQKDRNRAAHAPVDGEEATGELTEDEYVESLSRVVEMLQALMYLLAGLMSQNQR